MRKGEGIEGGREDIEADEWDGLPYLLTWDRSYYRGYVGPLIPTTLHTPLKIGKEVSDSITLHLDRIVRLAD